MRLLQGQKEPDWLLIGDAAAAASEAAVAASQAAAATSEAAVQN